MKKIKGVFLITSILFFISSLSPLLIPFSTGKNGVMNNLGYLAGGMFWIGLIPGLVGCILLDRYWKQLERKNDAKGRKRRPTAIRFFRNSHAAVIDCILIIGIAGVIYSRVNLTANVIIVTLSLTMMLAGFYGHFLLNGDIYQYIYFRRKMLKNRKEEKNEEN